MASVYDTKNLSSSDLSEIEALQKQYQAAQAAGDTKGMEMAHSMAENIRNNYGYSGGTAGNEYIPKNGLSSDNLYNAYLNSTFQNQYNSSMNDANNLVDYLKSSYDALASNITTANKAAVNQGVNRLNSQKSGINEAYDDNAKQAYILKMQNEKALPQQLAALGINGGASETSALGLLSGYENNLNTINKARTGAINDIDTAITDLYNTGDLNTAQQILANNQAALSAVAAAMQNAASTKLGLYDSYNNSFQNAINQQNYLNSLDTSNAQTEKDNALALAQLAAAYGDYSYLNNMGINTSNYNTGSAKSSSESSSSGSSSTSKPTLTYSQAKGLYDSGVYTDQVLNALEYYTGQEYAANNTTVSPVSTTPAQTTRVYIQNYGSAGAEELESLINKGKIDIYQLDNGKYRYVYKS
jgi:3D (Asp-Asp-Asp) domain-containing protein